MIVEEGLGTRDSITLGLCDVLIEDLNFLNSIPEIGILNYTKLRADVGIKTKRGTRDGKIA